MKLAFEVFNLLLSLSPLVYACYFIFVTKKKYAGKGLSWNLEHGMNCYSCKEEIETLEEFTQRSITNNLKLDDMKQMKVCLSCERDMKLSLISGSRIENLKLKFKEFLIKKYGKVIMIGLIGIVLFLTLDFFMRDYVSRTFFYIGQTFQLFYWYCFVQRWKLIHEKTPLKTSEV